MAVFFKGARPGTHYWQDDNCPEKKGFCCARQSLATDAESEDESELDAIVRHITSGSHASPYVSLTKSFAIARGYAWPIAPIGRGKVWEIHVPDSKLDELLVNPIQRILSHLPRGHLHNGDTWLLRRGTVLPKPEAVPVGKSRQWINSEIPEAFHAIHYALRDAEMLATSIKASYVKTTIWVD